MALFCRGGLIGGITTLAVMGCNTVLLGQTPDSVLDTAERLIRRATVAAKDAPLAQNAEAGQIITALRTSKDKDLIPVFEKFRQSKWPENQLFGMVAAAIITQDSQRIDLQLLFSNKDTALSGSAIASLMDAEVMSVEQMTRVLTEAPEPGHRAMAAGELNRRMALKNMVAVNELLKNDKEIVRYYAAVTLLSSPDPEQLIASLAALRDMSAKHDLRQAPIQALMLLRIQKENTAAGIPWAAQLAADEANDEGLRYTAIAALLSLKSPDGPRILGDMMQKQTETAQQVKLGLISVEYANQLKPATLEPLVKAKSTLVQTIGKLAQKAAGGADNTPDLLTLLKEGHPIILDWALAYADRIDGERRLGLRTVIVNQATIVDNARDRDYERAALAAEKMLNEDGPAGRKTIAGLLKSDNRAVVEATLAGIYRSTAANQSEVVMAVWDGLTKTSSAEIAANYASLILAREGRKEPLTWLPGMVMGGTAQGIGFRALAGWYYAKLQGQQDALLKFVLAD